MKTSPASMGPFPDFQGCRNGLASMRFRCQTYWVSDSAEHDDPNRDVAILCGPTEDRQGQRLLRLRQGALQAGEARPIREGVPLHGRELVRLRPRAKTPQVCDVEVLHAGTGSARDRVGPAQVATDLYRDNWERIFGSGQKPN